MSMALDFKEEFRPSRNFSLSPSIGIGRSAIPQCSVTELPTLRKTTVSGMGGSH
jgi:hypothetical protein